LTSSIKSRNSISTRACSEACRPGRLALKKQVNTKTRQMMFVFSIAAFAASVSVTSRSQSLPDAPEPPGTQASQAPMRPVPPYVRPSQRIRLNNYAFDTFGPFPLVISATAAGINQFTNSPPEWQQGTEGYFKRWGSDFGIATVSTTTRFALSEALKEDELYYRCECRGVFPRLGHALISTLVARRGDDGHRVFSVPALVAPYAGSMTAIYGWYPRRYGAKDAFRTGNYSLLAYAGGNVGMEFLYSGPHSLLNRMHLNSSRGSPDPGPNHPDAEPNHPDPGPSH
jgi:hypothetical protein